MWQFPEEKQWWISTEVEAIDNIKQLQRISLFGRFLKYEAGEYVHV